jgi:ABC-type lipoprotein release transport system permease subunit
MYLFLPGGIHYRFFAGIFPLLFLLLALIIDFGVARLMSRQRQWSFVSTFGIIVVATSVGAILVSMAIVRGHWFELVKELLRLG